MLHNDMAFPASNLSNNKSFGVKSLLKPFKFLTLSPTEHLFDSSPSSNVKSLACFGA